MIQSCTCTFVSKQLSVVLGEENADPKQENVGNDSITRGTDCKL